MRYKINGFQRHTPDDEAGSMTRADWWLYALIALTVLVVCAKSQLGVEIVKAIGGR